MNFSIFCKFFIRFAHLTFQLKKDLRKEVFFCSKSLSVAMTAAVMIVFAAAFVVMVMVMCAFHSRVEFQSTVNKSLCFFVCVTTYTAAQFNTFGSQRCFCTAANTAADQNGYTIQQQEVCQQAVTAAKCRYDFAAHDLTIFNCVHFEFFCVTEVLEKWKT